MHGLIETNLGKSVRIENTLNFTKDKFIIGVRTHTAKHAVSPGMRNCMWPVTAFSLTPDSNHFWPHSLHAWNQAKVTSSQSTKGKGHHVQFNHTAVHHCHNIFHWPGRRGRGGGSGMGYGGEGRPIFSSHANNQKCVANQVKLTME